MTIMACEDLCFSYEGREAVSHISFEVEEGDYLCIIGENGAGKSTLLRGLLHLKKPSSGRIRMGEGMSPTEIGYLPQQTESQKDFPASVREVVLSGCLNRIGRAPFFGRAEKKRAEDKMKLLGIWDLRGRCFRDLSGGQRQRVLLARAMCATGKLLLLDEPVTGLDPVVTADLYRLIRRLNREEGLTVIMVSHDIRGAVREASHILHLDRRQVFFGSAADYADSRMGRAYLGGRADDSDIL